MTFIDDGSESPAGVERDDRRKTPAAVASTSADATSRTAEVEPDLISRVTQPKPEPRMIGLLRRIDSDDAYVIHGSSFRIGREKQCDIVIPEGSVSRLHAEITLSGRSYYLRHLGRTETRLNGKPVVERHPLGTGDVIQIGSQEFAFVLRKQASEDVAPGQVTPVRSAVADAPTEMPDGAKGGHDTGSEEGGSRAFTYVLLALLVALLVLIALG